LGGKKRNCAKKEPVGWREKKIPGSNITVVGEIGGGRDGKNDGYNGELTAHDVLHEERMIIKHGKKNKKEIFP